MNIKEILITNFTAFEDMELNFSNGINVLIGKNGTGKTHVLKALYAICEGTRDESVRLVFNSNLYFSVGPEELIRSGFTGNAEAKVSVKFIDGSSVYLKVKENSDDVNNPATAYEMNDYKKNEKLKMRSVFIPAKEMLSHSRGFLALYNKYKIPFDKTYVDILTNAELPEAREVSDLNHVLLNIVSDVIQGEVIHENGAFYIVKKSGRKLEFPIEAEGLRKFGLLWKLLKNGLLEKGTILFWDEPEANINPELMPTLVEILLELERNGLQIFIATHSYNLAKYLEIKRNIQSTVLFHHLHQTDEGVKAESNSYFGELEDNPIVEADAQLLDDVIEGHFDE